MSAHDPLCEVAVDGSDHGYTPCQCEAIAKARADERERCIAIVADIAEAFAAEARGEALPANADSAPSSTNVDDDLIARARADEREQAAQRIEALTLLSVITRDAGYAYALRDAIAAVRGES